MYKNSVQNYMQTRIARTPSIRKRVERGESPTRRLTATEIRQLPKPERNRIMDEQFRKAKAYYDGHPELVIEAYQDVIAY